MPRLREAGGASACNVSAPGWRQLGHDAGMDKGWAALVAGVAALIGTVVSGWYAGRAARQGAERAADAVLRQVVDQGAIEHGHWLRGQRQEAYVEFLAEWDASMAIVGDQWEPAFLIMSSQEAEPLRRSREVLAHLDEARETAVTAFERVLLLGPETVDSAAAAMMSALSGLCYAAGEMSRGPQRDAAKMHDGWSSENQAAPDARAAFVGAVRKVLQASPRPSA